MFDLKPTEIPQEETDHIQSIYFEWSKRHEDDDKTKVQLVHDWEDWALLNMHKGVVELSWAVVLVAVIPLLYR